MKKQRWALGEKDFFLHTSGWAEICEISVCYIYLYIDFFFFFLLYPRHMKIPRPRIEPALQRWIFNPLHHMELPLCGSLPGLDGKLIKYLLRIYHVCGILLK